MCHFYDIYKQMVYNSTMKTRKARRTEYKGCKIYKTSFGFYAIETVDELRFKTIIDAKKYIDDFEIPINDHVAKIDRILDRNLKCAIKEYTFK